MSDRDDIEDSDIIASDSIEHFDVITGRAINGTYTIWEVCVFDNSSSSPNKDISMELHSKHALNFKLVVRSKDHGSDEEAQAEALECHHNMVKTFVALRHGIPLANLVPVSTFTSTPVSGF